jgi:hypothetical protein
MWKTIGESTNALIESPISLLIVLGVALMALSAAGGVTHENWFSIDQVWARIALGIGGLLTMLLGALLVRSGPRPGKTYGISILHPAPGTQIDTTDVRGEFKQRIPKTYELWVLRYYHDDHFVPLQKAKIDMNTKTWIANDCFVGRRASDTRYFVAALVGPAGQTLLSYFFTASERHNQWMDDLKIPPDALNRYLPLIANATDDIIECDRVNVKRK